MIRRQAWDMTHRFFTIGHSTRTVGEFLDLLRPQEVKLIVDVRTIPRSRTNPQYDATELAKALSGFEIGYQHIAELGGLRQEAGCAGGRKCVLGKSELSQLRGLRHERRVSIRPGQAASTRARNDDCDNVRRSRLVAVPSTDNY